MICIPKQNPCGTHSLLNEQYGKPFTHEHLNDTVCLWELLNIHRTGRRWGIRFLYI